MIQRNFCLLAVLLILASQVLHGQEADIQQRWINFQPAVMIVSASGTQISGQPVHAALDSLYIYTDSDFPIGPGWYNRVHRISYSDIDKLLLQKGGNYFSRARRSEGLHIQEGDKFYTTPFQAIHIASVYSDSLVLPRDLEDAFRHSKVLRQAFPDKHLRISFSAGVGGDRITASAEEALQQAPLPDPQYTNGQYWTLDMFDISWRFFDRLVVGGKIQSRSINSTLDAYFDNSESYGSNYSYGSYYYQIHFAEHVLYAEYAFKNVDRYFTRKSEFLAGAGLLLGRPALTLDTWVDYMVDSITNEQDQANLVQDDQLYGIQLRTSFHYYLFPGCSLWTGLEVDLYKPWTVEAMEVPSFSPPADPIQLQEHEINLFCIRLKFGVSFYL